MAAEPGLVGHAAERRMLLRALERGSLAHALLVTGEAGLGKRRFAEWLVAARWCEAAGRPCGACASCRKVASGNHPDLLVIRRNPSRDEDPDGLGSRTEITVEQVRSQLIPALAVRPIEGRGRAVIIDGADTLNEAAQNALLKTLEEPPRGCLLVLLASHEDALLATLRSRCQEVRLSPLEDAEMAAFAEGADARRLALAGGRPGRLRQVLALDVDALHEAFDAVLAGRLPGTAFARRVQELIAAAAEADAEADGAVGDEPGDDAGARGEAGQERGEKERPAGRAERAAPAGRGARGDADEWHRLAAELLLARLVERVGSGDLGGASAARLQAAQEALLELGPDLRRHIPPSVAWAAAGTALAGPIGAGDRDG